MNQKIKQELEDYLEDEINFDKLNLVNNVTKILENYRQHNQLYDYKVVCDNTNNFASDIDKIQIDVFVQPHRALGIIVNNIIINPNKARALRKLRKKKLENLYEKS